MSTRATFVYGMPVYRTRLLPFRGNDGRLVHMIRVMGDLQASPLLCDLLRGALTVESALTLADEIEEGDR